MHEPALFSTPFTFVHSFISLIFLLFTPSIYTIRHTSLRRDVYLASIFALPSWFIYLFISSLIYLY